MFADLSHSQFADWWTLYRMEPFGDRRADMRMARIAWATGRATDESKLMFRWSWQERPATPEEYQHKAMRAWAGAGGGITFQSSGES